MQHEAFVHLIECRRRAGAPRGYNGGGVMHGRAEHEAVRCTSFLLDFVDGMLTYKCWFYDMAMEADDGDAPR